MNKLPKIGECNVLSVVHPDDEPDYDTDYVRYRYSDELFDWFYSKLRYYSFSVDVWNKVELDLVATRRDNSHSGCRIFFTDGTYVRFYEVCLIMEFTYGEWEGISNIADNRVTVESVVNYYYSLCT